MPRWLQFLIFISIMLTVYGGAHYYLYHRLLAAIGPPSVTALWALRGAAVALALSFPLARFVVGAGLNAVTVAFEWCAVLWMGAFIYLFFFSLAAHLGGVILGVAGAWPALPHRLGIDPGRAAIALVAVPAMALTLFGVYRAACAAERTDLEVRVKNLPSALDGYVIVQISDVHIGVIVGYRRLSWIVGQVNALKPDLVVITGDLADENAAHLERLAGVLRDFKARDGVLAVTGNHEFYAGVDAVVRNAAAGGVRYLRNEKATVAGAIDVYGIDDPTVTSTGASVVPFDRVIGPEAKERPSILLYHQPRGFEKAAALGIDLMLSGHTHGGQLWPIYHITKLIYAHASGRFDVDGMTHYVSRGIGTWGPPLRVDSPPEVVKITLRPR